MAATPIAPTASAASTAPSDIRTVNADPRLTAQSILNVPYNLFADFVNIPQVENDALNFVSRSLLFSGPWMVVSATNLWGVDPGDPSHFQSTVNFMVPIPSLSGIYKDQNDQTGLGQQVWQLMAAILPVSGECDAQDCLPVSPTSPLTGITAVDWVLWIPAILSGIQKFPLVNNWFTPAAFQGVLGEGYTFGPGYPGYTDPSGVVHPGLGFPGTTYVEGVGNVNPWADTTFKLDLLKPLESYANHLLEDTPETNPIRIPNLQELAWNLQAFIASTVVAFDPFTPGSPFCQGDCQWVKDLKIDYPDLVRYIAAVAPGNPLLEGDPDPDVKGEPGEGWLTLYDNGMANVPTQEQIDRSIEILQQEQWNFGNPMPNPEYSTGWDPSVFAPIFHKLWTDLGLNPPPLEPTEDPGTEDSLAADSADNLQTFAKLPETTTSVDTVLDDMQSALLGDPATELSEDESTPSTDVLSLDVEEGSETASGQEPGGTLLDDLKIDIPDVVKVPTVPAKTDSVDDSKSDNADADGADDTDTRTSRKAPGSSGASTGRTGTSGGSTGPAGDSKTDTAANSGAGSSGSGGGSDSSARAQKSGSDS
jgi:uncharacterized membrane protein YgcG